MAEIVTSTGNAERVGTITYALGWTQHSTGVQMIRAAAMLQLLLGNVGRPGGGVNAFRGHSNIQGATDTAGTFEILPGYLKTPTGRAADADGSTYETHVPTTLNKQAWATMNYWSTTRSSWSRCSRRPTGTTATKENDFGYAWLPKVDGNYSWMYIFDDMYRGQLDARGRPGAGPGGLHHVRHEPGRPGPNSKKMVAALSKLKWMVVVENVETETAIFWKAPKEYGGADAGADPDRGLPAPGRRLRREGRHLHQLRALAAVEVEGARSAGPGQGRPGDPGAPRSSRCATSTRRKAARCPSRS